MKNDIILIYCVCDDYIRSLNHVQDGHNIKWSTAEVMTCWVIAMKHF